MTSPRSASLSAWRVCGTPAASRGAMALSAVAAWRSPRLEKLVRMAGATETMPSKYRGKRCDIIIASRPPVEQPTK